MKHRIRIIMLLLCVVAGWGSPVPALAQEQATHWSCDAYAYRYDMTAYLAVTVNGEAQADLRGYEIAAFCGDECRGVAEIQSAQKDGQTHYYAYLRIRSNQTEGETITFKVFAEAMEQEFEAEGVTVAFQSQQVVGLPSSPLLLNLSIEVLRGDANGDGRVSIADAVAVVDYILSDGDTPLIIPAADMDGNGRISIADAVAIVDYILAH